MRFKNLINRVTIPVTSGISKAKFKAVKYSPEICLVLAGFTGVATVVTACRATLKAEGVLNNLEDDKVKIEEAVALAKEKNVEYTEKDKNKDMTIAYSRLVADLAKLYAPAAALGALTAGLVFCSYRTMKVRHLGLIAAYTALDDGFRKYRNRTIEKFGEDVDRELASGVVKKEVMTKCADTETGEILSERKEVSTIDDVMFEDPSSYDRIFARGLAKSCTTYDPNTIIAFLEGQQTYFTMLLRTRGYVFLSEVYEALGFPVEGCPGSRLVGWILDPADPRKSDRRVSFGNLAKVYLKDGDYVHATGMIEPSYLETGYYLTFDIDGLIWNLI